MNDSKKYGGVEMDKTIGLIALAIAAIVAVVAIFGFLQVTGAAILTSKETTLSGPGSFGPGSFGPGSFGPGSFGSIDTVTGKETITLSDFEKLSIEDQMTFLAAKGLTMDQFEAMPEAMKKAVLNMVNLPDEAMMHPLMKLAEKGMPLAVFESLPKNVQETILTMKFGVSKETFDTMDESTKEAVIADEGLVLTK